MKTVNWLLVAALAFAIAALVSFDAGGQSRPSRMLDELDTTDSRPLSPEERAYVQQAISNIYNPPPASIVYNDAAGTSQTVSTAAVAYNLQWQLDHGRLRVDTVLEGHTAVTLQDGRSGASGDQQNLASSFLDSLVGHPNRLQHLEEIIVHERMHKKDSTGDYLQDETAALAAELAYKDSIRVAANDRLRKIAQDELARLRDIWNDLHSTGNAVFPPFGVWGGDGYMFLIRHDTSSAGVDSFASFVVGDTSWITQSLFPFFANDMYVFDGHSLVPPGHLLLLMCGSVAPDFTQGRLAAKDFLEGEILPFDVLTCDFGPPEYTPMSFYAMTRRESTNLWYVLDTLNQQILTMADVLIPDELPDTVVSVYASAFWPGFEMLDKMRGVDAATHADLGNGIIVSYYNSHLPHVRSLGQSWVFLPDTDGDEVADACVDVPAYAFLKVLPAIQEPVPWVGDQFVTVLGTWRHEISVWVTDEFGNPTGEMLGIVPLLMGAESECPLLRPLMAGEYILAIDEITGLHEDLPTAVVDPMPKSLTLYYDFGGQLHLRWEAVPGADHYLIYGSEDAVEYFWSGEIAETNEYVFPAPPMDKFFWRVTAER